MKLLNRTMAGKALRLGLVVTLIIGVALITPADKEEPGAKGPTNAEKAIVAPDDNNQSGLSIAEKAANAHGGEAGLNKLRISKITYTVMGKFPFLPGAENVEAKIEETQQ